ncbi:energy transducer TonB [Sediminicola luteus]|uniref:TonB C-terminal domain-containing protein n=1 Tax=Sediminicola luteus TaxID=319238 RepID=A0A2A4G5N5_9FLAO|nr:energy transducer TonB [Sediminicola luteus]PCE63300.1 hypothetical protein B7P33_13855 [Sediminicola luteus]
MRPVILLALLICCLKTLAQTQTNTSLQLQGYPCAKERGDKTCLENSLQQYLAKNIVYPADASTEKLTGNVYVYFEIDSLGEVSNTKLRSTHPVFEPEAKRLLAELPSFKSLSDTVFEKPIKVTYPIKFLQKHYMRHQLALKFPDKNILETPFISEVKNPPVFIGCEGSTNIAKCLKTSLSREMSRSLPVTKQVHSKTKLETSYDAIFYYDVESGSLHAYAETGKKSADKAIISYIEKRFAKLISKDPSKASVIVFQHTTRNSINIRTIQHNTIISDKY